MTRIALWLACLAAASPAARAAPPAPRSPKAIDTSLDACMQNHVSTAEMVDCAGAAARAYDATLNATYQALLAGLDAKSAQKLRDAQRKWLQFRDADAEVWQAPWTSGTGTILRVQSAAHAVSQLRARVESLAELADAASIDLPGQDETK